MPLTNYKMISSGGALHSKYFLMLPREFQWDGQKKTVWETRKGMAKGKSVRYYRKRGRKGLWLKKKRKWSIV